MKKCPLCDRIYAEESFSFCLADGSFLSDSYDPNATIIIRTDVESELKTTAQIDDPVIAININQQFPHVHNANDLYNCTRGMWRLNCERANKAIYLFAVYQGEIKQVYEINRCIPATKETIAYWKDRLRFQGRQVTSKLTKGRSEFIGRIASETALEKYVGRQMPGRPTQNPIRYINC